jgi:hypothetical protein
MPREQRGGREDHHLLSRTCAQVSEAAWRSMPLMWVQFNAGSMTSCHAVRVRSTTIISKSNGAGVLICGGADG